MSPLKQNEKQKRRNIQRWWLQEGSSRYSFTKEPKDQCLRCSSVPSCCFYLGTPLCSSSHHFSSILETKQMLTLHFPGCPEVTDITSRDRGERLKHTVSPALPAILQSHAFQLLTLQHPCWSTLQYPPDVLYIVNMLVNI